MSTESGMNGMMVMLASLATRETLITQLEKGIFRYNEAKRTGQPEEELANAFNGIAVACILIISKSCDKNPFKQLEILEKIQRAMDLITPNEG